MSIWEQLNNTGVRDSRVEAQERYEEEKKRQQEAARQQAEAKKQEEEKKKARTKDPLKPLKDAVRPVAQGLEDFVQGAQEGLAGVVTGETPEQFRKRQQQGRQRLQEADRVMRERSKNDPAAETVRVLVGGAARVVEGIIDTSSLIGDTAVTAVKAATGQRIDPKDNPFSAEYVAAKTDLGLQAPNTQIGRLGRDLMAFGLTGIAAARRLPQAAVQLGTKGGGLKGAIASGIVPGAVADFLLSNPEDGNLSNLVQEMVPEQYRDTFMFALAADDEDNPWVARTKAVLEGGLVGAVADSFMWMVHGRFVARALLRQGKSQEEALKAGLEAASTKKTELETKRLEDARIETVRWSDAQEAEMRKLNMEEADFQQSIEEARANGIPDEDPTLRSMEDELARVQLTKAQLENEVVSGYRPDGEGRLPQEAAASMSQGDVNKAFVQQENLSSGALPTAVRRPGVREADSVGNAPAIGGSERILTDANYRLMNMDEATEQVVRDIEQRVDIQEIAKSLKTTDDAVVEGSSRLVEDIMGVFRDTDGDPPDIVELLKERGATQLLTNEEGTAATRILTREGVVAMKTMIAQTAEDIYQLSLNADAMRLARASDGNQFDRMLDRLESMVTLVKVTGNKFGGGLRSFGLTDAELRRAGVESDTDSLLSVKEMKKRVDKIRNLKRIGSPEADAEIQALTRAMALAGGDPTKTVKFGRLVLSLGSEQAMNVMYNSIFSGPISQLRNFLGTSYAVVERPTSLLLKGLTGDEVSYRAAFAGYKAMQESVFEAWNVAATTFKTGDSINSKNKFVVEDFETQAILQRMEAVANTPAEQTAVGWVKALYNFNHNPYFSWPTRALTAADDFFKTIVARQHIKMEATAAALTDPRFAGNFDQGVDSYLREFSKRMDPETGRILDQDLLEIAEKATFQEDPGPMIGYLTKFLEEMPLGRVLVPFVRTPANLLRYGGTHVPGLNLFIKEARDALLNDATTPAAMINKAQYQGRMAIGAMAVAAPAIWAFNDNLTGNGPPPGAEREAWLLSYQPMSIRVGNKWVSYQGIEPLSSIMSVAGDAVMLAKMGSADAAERLIGQLGFSIAAAVTEKSFLAGLATIGDMLNPRNMSPQGLESTIYNTLNNFVPMAGARRALYNTMRPYIMEVDGELQRALNVATGGLVMQGATRVDPLTGEEVPSFAGNFYNAVSPVRIMPADNDPVKKMLSDINFRIPRNTTGLGGVELTAKDRNELTRTMYELGLRERLEAVMKTPEFKEAAEAHRGRVFNPDNPEQMPPHYRSVWAVWTGVKDNALRQMSRTNMDFRQRVLNNKNLNRAARAGRYEAVQQILNSPN
jgi:hypothetical protein